MIEVVLTSLPEISRELSSSSALVGGGSSGMPAAVDAGAGTAIVASLMSWACENAAGFCIALDDAAAKVDSSLATYLLADTSASDGLRLPGQTR